MAYNTQIMKAGFVRVRGKCQIEEKHHEQVTYQGSRKQTIADCQYYCYSPIVDWHKKKLGLVQVPLYFEIRCMYQYTLTWNYFHQPVKQIP